MFRTYPVRNIYLKAACFKGVRVSQGSVIRSGNVHGVDVVTGETFLEYLVYLEDHRYHEYASVHYIGVAPFDSEGARLRMQKIRKELKDSE